MLQQFVNSYTGKEEKQAFSPTAGGGQFPAISLQSALAGSLEMKAGQCSVTQQAHI